MTVATRWLDTIEKALDGNPLLVLCRSAATQRELLRELTTRLDAGGSTGFAGLEITTLRGFLAAREPRSLLGDAGATAPLSAKHPWAPLLAERPGLTRILRRHVARAQSVIAAGAPSRSLRPELASLVTAWPAPPDVTAALSVIASPPPVTCFAVGFPPDGVALSLLSPLDRAVLAALKPVFLTTPVEGTSRPFAASTVPDVAAEARAVALFAAPVVQKGGRVLVLVASDSTEDRVRSALARNGLASADDDSVPLTGHSLAAILAPLVPLFGSRGVEPVEAEVLLRLTTDPVLARTAPGDGIEPIPELGDETARASTRHVREAILACHRVRATLAEWLEALAAQEKEATRKLSLASPDSLTPRARRLASLRVLLAQVRALDARAHGSGRLSGLADLVGDLRLASPSDRLGRAIQGALRAEGFRPATDEEFEEALSGALGSRRVDHGIQFLRYGSFDGRDADLLLLCDLHDKGVARAPTPDPLLRTEDLAVLGMPTPALAVEERLQLIQWAASVARGSGGTVAAFVTETDSSGRRVSPPVGLPLVFDETMARSSFGLDLALPERTDRAGFARGAGAPSFEATQVDAEWARRGVAFEGAASSIPPAPDPLTLDAQIGLDLPRHPPDLRPWLGEVGATATGGPVLPKDFQLSASRLRAFTGCLFKAYCESILRLEAPEEPTEDLDPREVGTAVHAALQVAMKGRKLLVPEKALEAQRQKLLAALEKATTKAVEDAGRDREGLDSEPLRLARDGLTARWLEHWKGFVASRVAAVEQANEKRTTDLAKELVALPEIGRLAELIEPELNTKPDKSSAAKRLAEGAIRSGGAAAAFLPALLDRLASTAKKLPERLEAKLAEPAAKKLLAAILKEAKARAAGSGFDPSGDLEVVATELPFGAIQRDDGTLGQPLRLRLGRADVLVRGRIDAVLRRRGPSGDGTSYEVRDFKSGGKGSTVGAGMQSESLILPQNALYGLVLETSGILGKEAEPVRVERLTLDYVEGTPKTDVLRDGTQGLSAVLGAILNRASDGSFPTIPHPLACPLSREFGAYCDFGAVCRMRIGYEPETGADATSTDEEVTP
jgi:hypothetical protein